MNKNGGVDPQDPKDMERAKNADLITLPPTVKGTNCFNCKFVRRLDQKTDVGFCMNSKVLQSVTGHMCCALWDHTQVQRPWNKT